MFSYIDNKLIAAAQWVVRQIELHTSIQAKTIISSAFIGFILMILARTLIGLQLAIFDSLVGIFLAVAVVFSVPLSKELFRVTRKYHTHVVGVLPGEIFLRYPRRGVSVFLFVNSLVFYLMWTTFVIIDMEDDLFFMTIKILVWESLFLLMTEYLLCTTSLPPGEKEKRKQEREMRNAAPSAA